MPLTPEDERELARCFDYHQPDPQDRPKYEAITAAARQMAETIFAVCPPGADRDAALVRLREARMVANASIACKVKP